MQASMNEFVQFLEGRDDGVHQSTENSELMEPRSPSSREDSRTISKQLDDSNKLPPPSYIEELVFGILGISEAEQNTAAPSLCLPRDVVPSGRPSDPKTFAIDGSNESYGGNWDEGLLENDYDFPCLSSYAHEVVITTETQSSGTADKEIADQLVANANEYSLDVLAQEKLDGQGFQVEEALHMAAAPNVMCKSVIDTLQEDSTFFEDMGFDMRNSTELKDCKSYYESSTSEINAEGSQEDVSPACSNLHIVPMSDGMMEVTSSPPEEFAVSLNRDGVVEMGQVSSPDVAKVPISTGQPMTPPTCQVVASTSQRPVLDLSSCCGPYGAVVKNQIVLACSGDAILSENESLDSQDMPKLVRADDPPQPVTDQIYDSPPELDRVDLPPSNTAKKGVKTTTSTLASAAGEDLLKSSKKVTLGGLPETIQEATSQEELNDSLGKIVPSFTPDISNQIPAYMNEIYDIRNISLEPTCSSIIENTTSPPQPPGSLPLLPVTEEPKVYKTFKKVSPTKKTKSPDIKSKDSCGVDKGFVRDLLRSVNGAPNSLSGPNCVVEFTNKAPVKHSIRKGLVVGISQVHEKHLDSSGNNTIMGNSLFSSSPSTSTKNVPNASMQPKSTPSPSIVEESSLKMDFKSLSDLPTLLEISGVRSQVKVRSNLDVSDRSAFNPSLHKKVSSSERPSSTSRKTVPQQSKKSDVISQVATKGDITTCSATSSTTLKKTTTIIANVAGDVVNGVRVPQTVEDIKMKKSAQIKMLEKPVASTSVKVSLPISSLDLFSVKPITETAKRIDASCKENTDVILGVSTPTMAQRKQYTTPSIEYDSESLLVEGASNESRNDQTMMKKKVLNVPNAQLGLKSMEGEVSIDRVKSDLITTSGAVTVLPVSYDPIKKPSANISPRVSEMNNENVDVSLNAKVIRGLLEEMNLTRRPVDLYKKHPETTNLSSTVVSDLDTPKKSCSVIYHFPDIHSGTDNSSIDSNNLPNKITATAISHGKIENTLQIDEQADGLKEHPVIDVINSLISSSKLPDLFEELPSSQCVDAVEGTSPVVEKLESKSQNRNDNHKVKSPLGSVPIGKTTSVQTAHGQKVEAPEKSKLKDSPDKEITRTCSSKSPGGVTIHVPQEVAIEKKPLPTRLVTKTLTQPALEKRKSMTQGGDENPIALKSELGAEPSVKEVLPRDFDKLKNQLKKSSPPEDNAKQKIVVSTIVERRRTRSSLDSPEKPIASQDGVEEQQCKAVVITQVQTNVSGDSLSKLRSNDVIEKSIILESLIEKQKARLLKDNVGKQKESPLTDVSKIPDTSVEIVQKQKVAPSQSVVDESQTTLMDNVFDQTKPPHTKTSPLHIATSASSESTLNKSKTEPSRIQTDEKIPKQRTTATKGVVNQLKTMTSNAQVEDRIIATQQSVAEGTKEKGLDMAKKETARNSLQGVEKKKSTMEEEVCERKPLVDKSKTISCILVADGTKTTPVQDFIKGCKRESQNMIEKGLKTFKEDVEQIVKNTHSEVKVVERKSSVNKVPTISMKAEVDETKTSTQQVVTEKPKEKVHSSTAKESPRTLKEVLEKKKSTPSKGVVVVERNTVAGNSKSISSSSTEVGMTEKSNYQETVKEIVIGTVKKTIKTSHAIVGKRKNVHSKEEVSERKPVTDKPKTDLSTTEVDVSKMSADVVHELNQDDVQGTVETEGIKTIRDVSEERRYVQSKQVLVQSKPTSDKLKSGLTIVAADKINLASTQSAQGKLKEKLLDKVGKNTKSPLEVSEKKKSSIASCKEEVVGIPSKDKSKPSSDTSVAKKNKFATMQGDKTSKPKLVKDIATTSHNVVEKEKSGAQQKEIVAERLSKGKSKPSSNTTVYEKIKIGTPLDIDNNSELKLQKDNATTSHIVEEKEKSSAQFEEVVSEQTEMGNSKLSSNTTVPEKMRIATPLDVDEKSKPKLQKENATTFQNLGEKGESSVRVKNKEVVQEGGFKGKSKPSSNKPVSEKIKIATLLDVEKSEPTFQKENTTSLHNLAGKENSSTQLKEVVGERPSKGKSKPSSNAVEAEKNKIATPQDVDDKSKPTKQKENATASHNVAQKEKSSAQSKEVVSERPSKGKSQPSNTAVADKNKIASPLDVNEKSKLKLRKDNASSSHDVAEIEKNSVQAVEVVSERPFKDKFKSDSNTVVAENNKIDAPQDVDNKSKPKLQKDNANTSLTVSEIENSVQAEEVVSERPFKDKPKSSSNTIVAERNETATPQVVDNKSKPKSKKENATTSHDVAEKVKSSLQTSVLVTEPPSEYNLKPSSPAVANEKLNVVTQVVSEKHKGKFKDSVKKESSQALPEGAKTKQVVVAEREETVFQKVVDVTETSITQRTTESFEKRVDDNESRQTSQIKLKKKTQIKEVFVDVAPSAEESKLVSSKVALDNTKTNALQDVDKLKEKVSDLVVRENTKTTPGVIEKQKSVQNKEMAEKTEAVSLKVLVDNTNKGVLYDETSVMRQLAEANEKELGVAPNPSPTKGVAKKHKSDSKLKSSEIVQKSKPASIQSLIDDQSIKPKGENEKNPACIKRSKSSDLLVGMVKSRTTKMVHTARQLSSESIVTKKNARVDKAKKPALGHWRIVKQDKETTNVDSQSVSKSKIDDGSGEETKNRSRKRSETSMKGKSENNNGHSSERLISTIGECSDKVAVKDSTFGATKVENPIRLRTRSETSNERKFKDDEQISSNSLPKQIVTVDRNTSKQSKEMSSVSSNSSSPMDSPQKPVESSIKTSVKQCKKPSNDNLKPVVQTAMYESVIEDNNIRSRTRSETSMERKVHDVKTPSECSMKETSGSNGLGPGEFTTSAQYVDEKTVGNETNNSSVDTLTAAEESDPIQQETKTRLRTRSEKVNEKKFEDQLSCQSNSSDKKPVHNEFLAKQITSVDKNLLKPAKNDVSNVDVKTNARLSRSDTLPESSNQHRLRTRSETSSEKKLRKDDKNSLSKNQPLNSTKAVPKSVDFDKIAVDDSMKVYDFIDDDAPSNIHTIDQFRTLSGKSVKNKRSPSEAAMEDSNKLNNPTRKSRSENAKVRSGKKSRKSSPKKIPTNKDAIVSGKINRGNGEQKSPEQVSSEVGKEGGPLLCSSDEHSGSKEGAATRSRSRDLSNEENTASPTRVLRSKLKQPVTNNPATNSVANFVVDVNAPPLDAISDQKAKVICKNLHKSESSCGKCDITTVDSVLCKHQSALTKSNVEKHGIEDVENTLNKRKTRSCVKLIDRTIDNSTQESCPTPKDNTSLPKLRSSSSRKLNVPNALTNEGVSGESNMVSKLKYVNSIDQRDDAVFQKDSLEDEDSLSDTVSLKSEKVGDDLKIIIKRVKKPVQGDKADNSLTCDSDVVQKSVRETTVDVMSKEKLKPLKTVVSDVGNEVLPNQSTMLSPQDNNVCNAEAVSLKTPPMGSVVTPESDNIQAVNDMSQHREPEGAKSSTRTAQLRSLVLSEGLIHTGREQVSFQRDKDRVEKKKLDREDKQWNMSPTFEKFTNKSVTPSLNSPSTVEIVNQWSSNGQSSRNSSPSKISILESNKVETSSITDGSTSENEDFPRRRVTRSSLASASDSLPKSSKKRVLDNICSKPRRGSVGTPNTIKKNSDTSESSVLQGKEVTKDDRKQTGKRTHNQFEKSLGIEDEAPVKSKLRKTETNSKMHSADTGQHNRGSQSDCSKIMASVTTNRLNNVSKKVAPLEGFVLKKSDLKFKSVEASNKKQELNDHDCCITNVYLPKEKAKKDIDANLMNSLSVQDPVPVSMDVPLKAASPVIPGENLMSPKTHQGSVKSSSSRRKSKLFPPTKRIPSAGLIENGRKTSVKEVCLASESLDKILREDDIKDPSSFDVLALSPGKSPDSTTPSRADIVISKLALEPVTVNTKICDDSQGVTSTTEIEIMPLVNSSQLELMHETKALELGQGKKEDEGVSSTTVDSKICSIRYSDTKLVGSKKTNLVKTTPTMSQSIDESHIVRDKQTKKESIMETQPSKLVSESVSKQLENLEMYPVSKKKQSTSIPGVCEASDESPEYDVRHPRRKIWRLKTDPTKSNENSVTVQCSSRDNEALNLRSLSDEELKTRDKPLKKRQVWGIQLDNKVVNVEHIDEVIRNDDRTPEKAESNQPPASSVDQHSDELRIEDKKTLAKLESIQSPTSSVDQLRHSIFNILSVGPADKNTPTIQKPDSDSLSREVSTSSRLQKANKSKKPLKKLRTLCSQKRLSVKGGGCLRRRGLRKSSRSMASFPLRNGKMKLKKRMKKLKRVKTPKKEIVVVEHSRTSCEQPQILVGETLESSTKTTETQESLSSNIANIVLPHPNTVQNNLSMASPSKSTSSLLCHDILPSGTAQCSAPVVHNYKELNVDPCEDEDASPQFSPHPPREKGSVSPELQMQAPSNLSGSFMPVAPEWGNQCSLGTMVVQSSSSNGGSFSVSPQGTPRPITERSRSFSNLSQTSKPRARRDSHPALPPAVQSPTPVDLSFRRKKSRSHGSTSQLGVNPEGPMISSNIGKLDLNGKNPTFYTSYPGYKVTYDLAKNQVVLLNQTSASCVNQPVDTIPPMSVPMNEQLSVPVPSSSIPIRPIPKVRPAVVGTYPPLSGSRVKKDDFVPTAKSSFNEYSRLLCPQSLSAFHAMKSNNASSRSSNPANQHKKTDHNPLLFSHGTHFMLTPAEVSNIALLCPSTSATTLPSSNRRNKSTRSTRIKPDVLSPSSKTSFTNLKSHTDTGRSTDVRANEIICHKPLFNQSQANSLPFYPENSYKLSCVNNMNPLVHPSLLRPPGVLSVASERPYKSDRVRNDQVLIGRNQEALQKVVREFNEGMNSMKDSNAVLNTKEIKSDDGPNHNRSGVPVKALNLSDIGERNISEDCTSTINSTPPNVIDIEVEIMSSQLPTESKGVKLDHRKTILTEKGAEIPPNQSSKSNKVCATEVKVAQDSEPVLRCQQFSDQGVDKCHPIAGCMGDSEKRETLEVVSISSAPNMPSVSENCSDTLIDEEHNIECPDHNISKQPSTKESPIVSIESCPSPDSVIDVVSLPITESKDLENQVDPNCSGELDNVGNKTSEEQMILVTEIQSSSEITQVAADIPSRKLGVPELPQSVSETQSSAENPSYTQLFIPEQPLSVSEKVETVPEMDHNIIHESQTAVNLTSATDIPESKYVEATDHGKPAAVLLPEISLIQLDKSEQDNISNNIKETDVHINDYTATKIDESTQIHSKQQLQKLQQPEPSIKSKIELPTENCGIPLKPDDQVNGPMESVGTAIVPPPASSSLTSIEQNLGLPTDKMAPEIIDTCGYSVPFKEAKVDSVQFGVNGNYSCPIDDSIKPYSNDETDTMLMPVSIESQSQNTEKQADKPTDQIVPEKSHVCTDHLLLSEGVCQKDDSVKPESNEDTNTTLIPLTTESQIQNTEKYGTSDIVCFSEVSEDGRSGLLSSAVHTSKSDANLVDVSERLLGSAVDKSVDSDGTCDDACNGSSAGPDPNTDLKSSTPIGFTELRGKADIQLQSPQPLEQASKVSEAPEDPITSLTPQNSPEVTELPTDLCNQDLIPLDVVRDHESSCMSNLNTTLSSSPDATLNVSESRKSINSSVHSFTDESLILTTVPNSVSKECSDSSTGNNNSNLNCEDQIAKMESCNDRKTIEEKSVGSSISFCYSRKRKLAGDSEDEDVESIKSIDSINCRIKKRKQAHAKVKIRPISPTTVDEIVKSGIKIKHSELQDIVKCWQEYCRSHERVSRAKTVGRAGNDEATKITGREESRRPAGQSRRFEDDLSRPSTSRELRNDPSSPLNIPSPLISMRDPKEPKNVTAYLLEREREINRGLKRTTRVGELFARGVKIHQRDCNVKHSRVESFASSRRSSTIADALSTLPCVRPTIHRSYSWIVEHLRERRKKMDYMESMNIQSCKDFINGVSKDAVAGCQTTLSLAMATHSRLSAVHPPVTNWPPTNLGVTTITVISSDSEDSNAGGTEHTMKDRDEVRKRVRRKVGTTVNLPCSCQSPSQNSNSHVCPTCRKEKSHAHGASSPIRPSSTSLYTKVSNMQRREPERVMECAAAVGGGEETVIVPDSNSVHLLKALMTLAGRRPPTSDTYAPPYSLSCDDPRPTSHTEVFSLPYEKELISTRVTVTPDPPSHDAGPHPLPETVRGSSTQYLQEKPAPEEAPCIFERNDTDLQQHSEEGGAPRSHPLLHATTPGSSTLHSSTLPTSEMDAQCSVVERSRGSDPISCDSPSSSACQLDDSQAPLDEEGPSTSSSSEEANRLLRRVVGKLTPDLLVEIQRLLSGEPPSKKRKE